MIDPGPDYPGTTKVWKHSDSLHSYFKSRQIEFRDPLIHVMSYFIRNFPQELNSEMKVIPPDNPDVGPSVPELSLGIHEPFNYLVRDVKSEKRTRESSTFRLAPGRN
jgi:hypothetical protein